jgi:hypothetical protein
LQALVLLNDPTYVEASRALAQRLLKESKGNEKEKINWVFRQVLSRSPSDAEQMVLAKVYEKHLEEYRSDKEAAQKLLTVGDWAIAKDLDPIELAAWTSVARVILNLHETITRN